MKNILRPALVLFVALTAINGIAYPLLVTAIGQGLFADQANGSLVKHNGHVVGSALVGQSFTDPRHFWGRPSATATVPYNGAISGGSNQGSNNPALHEAVKARIAALREADPGNTQAVPVDLVTASGSGLDPHISMAAARYQAGRVARLRGLPLAAVERLVDEHTEAAWLGFVGEPRVHVLKLNLALAGTTN
jgi:potassium-transporting ATPase KdpC subunit